MPIAASKNPQPKTAAPGPEPGDSSGMYLQSLTLSNFRSCYYTTVTLQPTLTLLVGENNSGKSNVIEALRLATAPLNLRRTRYFEADDRSRGRDGEAVELGLELDGLTEIQQSQYLTALDITTGRVLYKTRFRPDADVPRRSQLSFHAGKDAGADAEPEKREQIRHVYLAPLRDAQRELDSANGSRLALIIEQLTDPADREKFLAIANESLGTLAGHDVVTKTAGGIQDHVTALTEPVRGQDVKLGFEDYELRRLARSLRLKMAEHGIEPADLAESGLGYANLLFIATVVLELQHAQDAELTLFLVEEPEAHLHPQLQAVLLDYLREQAEASARGDDSHGPMGRIQVIATTHSPNLASSVGIENVIVLRTRHEAENAGPDGSRQAATRHQTVALPLAALSLPRDDRRKINQYLDATRAAMLFARRIILVEGTAEAVLLPVLAREVIFRGQAARQREFHAVTIMNIGSVDFEPYIRLLLTPVNGLTVVEHLVAITDSDPDPRQGRRLQGRQPPRQPQGTRKGTRLRATAHGSRSYLHAGGRPAGPASERSGAQGRLPPATSPVRGEVAADCRSRQPCRGAVPGTARRRPLHLQGRVRSRRRAGHPRRQAVHGPALPAQRHRGRPVQDGSVRWRLTSVTSSGSWPAGTPKPTGTCSPKPAPGPARPGRSSPGTCA